MSKRTLRIARIAVLAVATVLFMCAFSFTNSANDQAQKAFAARFGSEYASKEEALDAGAELNVRLAEEGMVLLKNENGTLPLDPGGKGTDAARVTLFGYNSVFPEGGSALSDADVSIGIADVQKDVYYSMAHAGFKTNPAVKAAYTDWVSADEEKHNSDYAGLDVIDKFTKDIEYSLTDYNDAAIVVLGASGAPSTRGGRETEKGAAAFGATGHKRQFDKAQRQIFDYALAQKAKGVFDKVIVVINDSIPIELGYIDEHADAVILAGGVGGNGMVALGSIISGKVNPSGRLADTYVRDFTADPTYNNFGRNRIEPIGDGVGTRAGTGTYYVAGGNQYVDENGNPLFGFFVDYEEGIYVGYRYWETRGYTDGEQWYNDHVVYPFGYGKSYTDFSWTLKNATGGTITGADQRVTLDVEVENTGSVPGKDVVELYYTAPYTPGGIEKSHVVLGDFAKTGLLQPGEKQTVRLTVKARDMASYDYKKDNGDGTKGGYVLEDGTYSLKIMSDSHSFGPGIAAAVDYTVSSDIFVETSDQTGNKISNAFEGILDAPGAGDMNVLSRDDWEGTWPELRVLYDYDADGKPLTFDLDANGNIITEPVPGQEGKTMPKLDRTKGNKNAANVVSAADFATWDATNLFKDENGNGIADYDEGAPWYVPESQMPKYAKDAASRPEKAEVMLSALIGRGFDDPLWDKLLDQLTMDEMLNVINTGGYKSVAIDYIGKPETLDTDGPAGWSGTGVGGVLPTRFVMEPVIASTWNKELAYEMGKMIGEQGIWGRSDSGTQIRAYSGWYGAAMNTHRSPFLDRYAEYYSEDGYLAGMMAANSCIGAKERGCYTTVKHFAPHEDGATDRGTRDNANNEYSAASRTSGLNIWSDEQTLREIYFKPFQMAVELGDPGGAMSSFSRIGNTWCGGSYGLLTQILRDEWGFKGLVVTDLEMFRYINAEQMIRAGGDLVLAARYLTEAQVSADDLTATKVTAVRKAVKNVLYTVANSNAMDTPLGAAVTYGASALASATVGTAYDASVATAKLNTVSSYGAVIGYELGEGFLPDGLKFENGRISGTPTNAGFYTFTVTASASVAGFAPASARFSITVKEAKSAEDIANEINGNVDGKIDGAVKGMEEKLAETNGNVAGVSSAVTAALVISVIGALSAVVCVVLLIVRKKKNQ